VLTISGILGGSDRQTVWAAPVALIPYLFWRRRDEQAFRLHSAAAYIVCISCLVFLVSRFTQPYPGLELPKGRTASILLQNLAPGAGRLLGLMLCCAQVLLPALLCFVPFWRKLRASEAVVLLFAGAVLVFVSMFSGTGAAPFASSVLSGYGVLIFGAEGLGFRPELLSPVLRIALSMLIAFGGLFWLLGKVKRDSMADLPRAVFVIFGLAYLPLLIPGALAGFVHDRYVLPVLPAVLILVLHRFQAQRRALPIVAWSSLGVLAIYATVVTHDYAAAARARAQAAEALERSGVPRSRISAGLEYDAWTELKAGDIFKPVGYGDRIDWNATDVFWFWRRAHAVNPDYVAVTARAGDGAGGELPSIELTAWTPPFRRAVIVRRREDLPKRTICRTGAPCFL
jgi:hypothetical protein